MYTSTGIYYEELSGSPKFGVTPGSSSATRQLQCSWGSWQSLVLELVGYWQIIGLSPIFVPPSAFPGSPFLVVDSVNVEPFDDGPLPLAGAVATVVNGVVTGITITSAGGGYTSPPSISLVGGGGVNATANATVDQTTGAITGISVNSGGTGYTSPPTVVITGGGNPRNFSNQYKYAKLSVSYKTLFDPNNQDRGDLPAVPPGTYLQYSGDQGAEMLTIPGRTFYWGGAWGGPTQKKVGDDINPGILRPTGNYTLKWSRVVAPPWTAIEDSIGTINETEFVSAPPGTVLFLGLQLTRQFQFQGFQSTGAFGYWDLEYKFAVSKKLLSNGTDFGGWNHFYKDLALNGEHWVPITDKDSNLPYRSTEFRDLFVFEIPFPI